ncbi:hypothetical protein D3C77_804750 [compost metagenome]
MSYLGADRGVDIDVFGNFLATAGGNLQVCDASVPLRVFLEQALEAIQAVDDAL